MCKCCWVFALFKETQLTRVQQKNKFIPELITPFKGNQIFWLLLGWKTSTLIIGCIITCSLADMEIQM